MVYGESAGGVDMWKVRLELYRNERRYGYEAGAMLSSLVPQHQRTSVELQNVPSPTRSVSHTNPQTLVLALGCG